MIRVDAKAGMALLIILNVDPICKFCGVEITEENFGGAFGNPIIAFCNSLPCTLEFSNEEYEER